MLRQYNIFSLFLSGRTHNATPWNARRQDDPGHPLDCLHSLASKPALSPWTAEQTPPATALSGSSPPRHRQPRAANNMSFFNIQSYTDLLVRSVKVVKWGFFFLFWLRPPKEGYIVVSVSLIAMTNMSSPLLHVGVSITSEWFWIHFNDYNKMITNCCFTM